MCDTFKCLHIRGLHDSLPRRFATLTAHNPYMYLCKSYIAVHVSLQVLLYGTDISLLRHAVALFEEVSLLHVGGASNPDAAIFHGSNRHGSWHHLAADLCSYGQLDSIPHEHSVFGACKQNS